MLNFCALKFWNLHHSQEVEFSTFEEFRFDSENRACGPSGAAGGLVEASRLLGSPWTKQHNGPPDSGYLLCSPSLCMCGHEMWHTDAHIKYHPITPGPSVLISPFWRNKLLAYLWPRISVFEPDIFTIFFFFFGTSFRELWFNIRYRGFKSRLRSDLCGRREEEKGMALAQGRAPRNRALGSAAPRVRVGTPQPAAQPAAELSASSCCLSPASCSAFLCLSRKLWEMSQHLWETTWIEHIINGNKLEIAFPTLPKLKLKHIVNSIN